MIAPYQLPSAVPQSLHHARRTAAMLTLSDQQQHPPPVPAWRAWLLATWMVLVLACYALHVAGGIAAVARFLF